MNSADLPEPFVSADHDVSMLDGFMLNVKRLLASELFAVGTPEECWAAFMLWCRAWQQVPGGSLPNDERKLAGFSGAGPRWKKIRENALHGFVLCSDGRLYHRFLCEEVKRAFKSHMDYQARRDADRQRLEKWRKDRGKSEDQWAKIRLAVFERDGHKCQTCGSIDDLHCDHIVEAGDGGASEMHNLTTLCRSCHSRKTASRRVDERSDEMHFKRKSDTHSVALETRQNKTRQKLLASNLDSDSLPSAWAERAAAERATAGMPPADLPAEWAKLLSKTGEPTEARWLAWALKARQKPSGNGSTDPSGMPEIPWPQRCRGWAKGYRWHADWGPPPDEAGCWAPADVVAEAMHLRTKRKRNGLAEASAAAC
jgi:5-methylcytosine-specific restriction endonuclease McrA